MGQTVKVKAETSPDLETQPLLDPVQLDRTTPKTGSQNPPSRGGRKARKKNKIKHKAAPKLLTAAVRTEVSSGVDFVERKKNRKEQKVRHVKLGRVQD